MKNIHLLTLLFIVFMSCKPTIASNTDDEVIEPKTIERCETCLYIKDFDVYEINKGSKKIVLKPEFPDESQVNRWWLPSGITHSPNVNYHFYLRDNPKDSLNILVTYLTFTHVGYYNPNKIKDEHIVEHEIYKIFAQESFLDKSNISYKPKGNYTTLKNYFKGLTTHIPDSLMYRPENYYSAILEDENDYIRYYKNKEDIQTFSETVNALNPNVYYTMTLHKTDFKQQYSAKNKRWRDRDMAIYVTYFSEVPSEIFNRFDKFTFDNKKFPYEAYKNQYDSMYSDITKRKIDIIRKSRGQIPYKVFLDSIKVIREQKQ